MRRIRAYRPSPAGTVAIAALLVAIGGAAYAAIPDSGGTIHACYQKGNGTLRVVESSDRCRPSEAALDWNQRGPTGPEGPPGAGAEVLTEGDTVAPGETITLVEVPGLVRLTLRCPGPDDFAGDIAHYNYTAENLDPGEPVFVNTSFLRFGQLEPRAAVESVTTIGHERNEFEIFGHGRVVHGVMRLHRQPGTDARDRDCVFASQAVVSSVD